MTRHVPYDEFSKDPAKYMDEVDGSPLYVERKSGSVVIVSQDEFESLIETARLLGSPTNARRLMESIEAAEAGRLEEHGLIEER
jgi:antitoxin YefM